MKTPSIASRGRSSIPGRPSNNASQSALSWMRHLLKRIRPAHSLSAPRRHRRAAACVEMAFVAPFIFLLIFGAIEFARMMMVKQSLTNAAREGSRKSALITTQHYSDGESRARDYLRGTIAEFDNPNVVRVTCSPAFTTSPVSGTEITTSIEVDCADVTWLPAMFFAGAKIRGEATTSRE